MVLLLSVLTLINMVESVTYTGSVTSYKRLYAGDYIKSMNDNAFLALQGDGNLCLRYKTNGELIWTSNTNGNDGCELVVHTNGNVLMYCNGSFKWHSNTVRNGDDGPFTLTVHDEGYATLHDKTGNVYWYAGKDYDIKVKFKSIYDVIRIPPSMKFKAICTEIDDSRSVKTKKDIIGGQKKEVQFNNNCKKLEVRFWSWYGNWDRLGCNDDGYPPNFQIAATGSQTFQCEEG
eukprot:878031_1